MGGSAGQNDAGENFSSLTGVNGSFSTATTEGTTFATLGQGDITIGGETGEAIADQLAGLNRDLEEVQIITRDTSFSTGDLELDVGALLRAGENIDAVQAGLDEFGARRELLDAVAEAEEGLASFGLAAIEGGNGLTGNVLLGQAADFRGDVFQDLVAELGGLSGSLSDLDGDTLMRLVGVNLDDSVSEAAAEIERLGLTAQGNRPVFPPCRS